MTIGGDDLILEVPWEADDRDRILGLFRHAWPVGRYADARSSYVGDIHDAIRSAPGTTEFFVYESEAARMEWASEGATVANLDRMLYVIGNDESITLVVGRAHGPLAGFWRELIDVILRNRCITPRLRNASTNRIWIKSRKPSVMSRPRSPRHGREAAGLCHAIQTYAQESTSDSNHAAPPTRRIIPGGRRGQEEMPRFRLTPGRAADTKVPYPRASPPQPSL